MVKCLREAMAKVSVAAAVLGRRAQAAPGEDALEELRSELQTLRRENDALREGLKRAKSVISKLKARSAAAFIDSSKRTFRGG